MTPLWRGMIGKAMQFVSELYSCCFAVNRVSSDNARCQRHDDMIYTHREPLPLCTIHTVEGQVTLAEIARVMATYDHESPALLIIWDFREADTSAIFMPDIQRLVELASRCSGLKAGGKIAGVFSQDLGYGLGRMFQSYAEMRAIRCEFQCFRNMKDAQEWLDEGIL